MALSSFAAALLGGAGSSDTSRASLLIDGKRFDFWTEVEIVRSIDAFSTVGFSAPFEADRKEFRATFRPFSFKPVKVLVGTEGLFTGTMLGIDPRIEPDSKSVAVTCYGKPGVLCDCEPPASAYPLEFNGMDIIQIANQICAPFGITASVEQASIARDGATVDAEFFKKPVIRGKRGGIKGGKGSKFARLALKPGDDIHGFLVGLAKQRALVMADDEDGNVLFRNSIQPGDPVVTLIEGQAPLISVTPTFNPQECFSEITSFKDATRGHKGAKYTEVNPLATGLVRPKSFNPDDTDPSAAADAAKGFLARMFGNMVGWVVELPTWRDPQGKLFRPNTTLKLTAPDAMIFRPTELLIRSVTLRQKADDTSCALGVVLPGAFSGDVPDSLPWDDDDLASLRGLAH
jgi:prophage tail gpP-like protein